jgi:flagellin
MSSLLTNASALTALQSLNITQQNLATTQGQISTGLKVANASDNAAYWSIAQSLQSNTGVLGAVNDSVAQSQSILGAATAALNNVITTIQSIQTVLTEAESPSADLATINTTLKSLGQELTSAVNSASYSGVNLLDGSQATLNFVSGYNVSSSGVASFNNVSLTAQALTGGTTGVASTTVAPNITDSATISGIAGLAVQSATASYGVDQITTATDSTTITSVSLSGETTATTYSGLDKNGNATTVALANSGGGSLAVSVTTTPPAGTGGLFFQSGNDLTSLTTTAATAASQITAVGAALSAITSYSSIIGSTSNTLANAATFNSALSNNYTTGIGALVDADMNQASTRLQALQTQQQLGVQSLSIANQSSQLILKLFQ